MKKRVVLLAICFFVLAFGILPDSSGPLDDLCVVHANEHSPDQAAETLYTCPMHPQIVQESPGQCPICGMDLVPQERPDEGGKAREGQDVILVDPVTVQNMGVRVGKVKQGVVHRHIRTFGRVEAPDDAHAVVNLKFSGWVETVWADKQGAYVEKGDKLFAIYSPEVFAAQEEYILALKNYGPGHRITKSGEQRLRLWDIPDWQVQSISKERTPRHLMTITAPASGYIEHVSLVEGSHVTAGNDLYRIIRLDKVWLKAEVYDFDAPWVRERAKVQIYFSIPGFMYREGEISFIYPTLNFKTRTLTVRVELENPNMKLRPGMIASMLIYGHSEKNVLTVPTESIINTGKRKIVFVTPAPGKYEPRVVETGPEGDNYVTEVISGLGEGETVVTSGQFLLDSESQLQEAVQKFLETQLQSASGVSEQDTRDRGHKEERKELYTCPMHPQIIQEQPGQCPICGMDLVRKKG